MATAALLSWGNGCAAIADLDQTYTVIDGATAPDGTRGNAADGPVGDAPATSAEAGDAGAPLDADGSPDALPPGRWSLDSTYGPGGYVVLEYGTIGGLPVIAQVDGHVQVAFASTNGALSFCPDVSAPDAGCQAVSATGYPAELMTNGATTVLLTNSSTSAAPDAGAAGAVDLASGGYQYQSLPGCRTLRGLSIESSGNLQAAASCLDGPAIVSFPSNDHPAREMYGFDLFADSNASLRSASAAAAGDVWFMGCDPCTATGGEGVFLRAHPGAATPSSSIYVGDGVDLTVATDAVTTSSGSAILVGEFGSDAGPSGLFTTLVPADDDGSAPDAATVQRAPVDGSLALEPASHSRLVAFDADGAAPYTLVSARSQGIAIVLLDVGADGQPASSVQEVEVNVENMATLMVGGAVSLGDDLYVALAATTSVLIKGQNLAVPVVARFTRAPP